jgi:hypothetical protein
MGKAIDDALGGAWVELAIKKVENGWLLRKGSQYYVAKNDAELKTLVTDEVTK